MPMGLRLLTLMLVSALALAIAAPAPAIAGDGLGARAFSTGELQRLEAGELVVRRVTAEQGALHLMGGTSWQVIDAAPELVWRVLLDTTHYPRILPQVREAKLVQDEGR